MRLYACTGQRQHALRQYQVLEEALRRELDVAPHPDTQRLYRDIAAGRLLPANQYRTPARVLPADDATTSSASGDGPDAWDASRADAAASPTNLPLPVNRFVGRVREQAEVKRLLATTRLLTLTGTGGCGKTRLALQVAADLLEEYPDGVWLVELAALADPALVPQAVASVLGVKEQQGKPLAQTLVE